MNARIPLAAAFVACIQLGWSYSTAKMPVPQEDGTIGGVIKSEQGVADLEGLVVSLKCVGAPERNQLIILSREHAASDEGGYRFAFQDVLPGDYTCILTPNNNLKWSDLVVPVRPPQDHLLFMCYDAGHTYDLQFASGVEGVGDASLTHMVWMGAQARPLAAHWKTGIYKEVSSGESLVWAVRARGFMLTQGSFDGRREGGKEIVSVQLRRGWGHVFRAETLNFKSLEGVEVLLDGRSAGRTDSRGFLFVNQQEPPSAVDVVFAGWRLASSPIDVATSPFVNGLESRLRFVQVE